jgi:Tfp pilus assembly protein PilN
VIEVNLLPGDQKKSGRRRRRAMKLSLPSGLGGDRWVMGAGFVVLVCLVAMAWLFNAVAGEAEELQVQIEAAQQDSIRFAGVIDRTESLQARRDSIARRVAVIQEIDGARYVWPHIMDEVARALPEYTWLTRIHQVTAGDPLVIRVEGRAGTYFALTSLMEGLEASPFMRGTRLVSADQIEVDVGGGAQRRIYTFTLEAEYRTPPADFLQTEPLFSGTVQPPSVGGN